MARILLIYAAAFILTLPFGGCSTIQDTQSKILDCEDIHEAMRYNNPSGKIALRRPRAFSAVSTPAPAPVDYTPVNLQEERFVDASWKKTRIRTDPDRKKNFLDRAIETAECHYYKVDNAAITPAENLLETAVRYVTYPVKKLLPEQEVDLQTKKVAVKKTW